ncbi:MAG: ribonuclease P protein component [bacterium]
MSSSGGGRRAGRSLPCDRRLRRNERITEQFEYKEVIRNGRVVGGRLFKAYLLTEPKAKRKAGFIAGKGVGDACARNRARRLMREAYRQLKPDTKSQGFRVVFVAGRGIASAGFQQVQDDMRGLFSSWRLLVTD